MQVLVTGGTGFLGEHLVRFLLERSEQSDHRGYRVRVLARSGSSVIAHMDVGGRRPEVVRGDVLHGPALAQALEGCGAVFHLAGMVSRNREDGQRMMRLHVDGTRRVLEHMHKAQVKRMVLASTSGTVAVSKDPEIMDEDAGYATEVVAGWPYYASKIYQETLAFSLGKDLGIDVVAVNPSLLLGPGDRRLSSTNDVVRFLRNQMTVVPEGGVNFVDARDAAAATLAALERGRPGERYLLGGPNWTVEEFFARLGRASDQTAKAKSKTRIPLPARWQRWGASAIEHLYRSQGREPPIDRESVEMAQHYWWMDTSKAERELGFRVREPTLTLVETVAYLRRDLGMDDL